MLLKWGEKYKMSHDQLKIKFESCSATLVKANSYIELLEKNIKICPQTSTNI